MLDEYGGFAAYELDGSGFALRGGGRVDVIASCESQCREGASLDISQQISLIRGNNAVSGTIDGDPVGDLQLEGKVVIFANPVNVPQDVTPGTGIYTLQTSFMAVGTFDAYNEAGQVVRAMRFAGRGTATIAVLFGSVEEVTYAFSDEPPSIHPLGD